MPNPSSNHKTSPPKLPQIYEGVKAKVEKKKVVEDIEKQKM
jgi:hypothetical protein